MLLLIIGQLGIFDYKVCFGVLQAFDEFSEDFLALYNTPRVEVNVVHVCLMQDFNLCGDHDRTLCG